MTKEVEVLRAADLISKIKSRLSLNLEGRSVLTEAGSNYFIYTPLIAYYSGASSIYVWIKDTVYGSAESIRKEFLQILNLLGISSDTFHLRLNERPEADIAASDIITNLGFVRPLDAAFLGNLNKTAVVSYMCEAWEVRAADVDIEYCKENNIPVAGVWEDHPDLLIFKGCGQLSVKLCMEAGLEVYQNSILIISDDKFGKVARESFVNAGAARVDVQSPAANNISDYSDYDLIFISDYSFAEEILSNASDLTVLKGKTVVHLCGKVNFEALEAAGVNCYPRYNGQAKRMTKTLAHLGLKPIIDLHAAGLKVGELLYNKEASTLVQSM